MGDVDRDAREYFILLISRAIVAQIRRESHHRQDLLKLFQVVCPILAGGASASTSFVRRSHGAEQHSPMLSDSPVILEPLVDWSPKNGVDGCSIPTFDDFIFFRLSKSGYIRGTMNT